MKTLKEFNLETKRLWVKYKRTPLMLAARDGDYNEVKRLLADGADPAVKDTFGDTAIHFAEANAEDFDDTLYVDYFLILQLLTPP